MPENLFVYMVLTCTGWRQGWGRGEAYVKRRRGQNFCLRPEHLQIYDNDAPTMMYNLNIHLVNKITFSALILLVWRQEEILAFKKNFWVMRRWCGTAKWKWFAYGPADATGIPTSLA